MTICTENLSRVRSIIAYPVGVIDAPFPIYSQQNCCDLSVVPIEPGMLIRFMKDTLKCANSVDMSLAGIAHTIQVEWDAIPSTKQDYDNLIKLQNVPHELVLTYLGGQKKIIRTDDLPYRFVYEQQDGVTRCRMTLVNGQGMTSILVD